MVVPACYYTAIKNTTNVVTWRTAWMTPHTYTKKITLKMGVPCDPTIPLLDIDLKEIKSHIKISYQIDPYLPMLTPILFTSGKTQMKG